MFSAGSVAELKASDGKCIQMICVVMMGMKRVPKVKVSKGECQRTELANCFSESESIGTYSSDLFTSVFSIRRFQQLSIHQEVPPPPLSSLVIYNCGQGEKELPQPSYSLSHFPSSCCNKGWKTMASRPNLGCYLSIFFKWLEQFKRRLFCCI